MYLPEIETTGDFYRSHYPNTNFKMSYTSTDYEFQPYIDH